MKKLILKYGELILSLYLILGIVGSTVLAFNAGYVNFLKSNNILHAVLSFLLVFVIGTGIIIIFSYVVYLLIDIRDKIKELLEKKQ
ncbi:MAG: hypothetical protein QMD43_05615 [Thermodesulfovibrio sp.]|jgi:hypothetical protein|uniref:hypothetical protein n=1 Tax=unclassified Thermodesulfovibrio TaxID=2645936 RepID=UPI00083BA2B3|nr:MULTISPECIES: hypothetical protein [unclassified Thermodesulfovibrio]MDI1472473.1 hypothetical protein [Thermodesulfovibrio sp. 1176]MDI6714488.1 hypothetical protein [Thermodesulfovibrio sp.]ODA43399.1 hypothetical protein THER_1888 [Thermodesulfovibrio sp. N1]